MSIGPNPMMTPGPGTLQTPTGAGRTPTGVGQTPVTPPPTTLGGAAGQVEPPRPSRAGFFIAGGLVVAAAIAGIAIVASNKSGETTPTTTPGTASNDAPKPDPKPPEVTMAKVILTTTPPGAEIFVDGVDQNVVTPNPFKVPRGKKTIKVTLKHDGYLPNQHEVTIDSDVVQDDVVLIAKEEPKPPEAIDAGVPVVTPDAAVPQGHQTPPNNGHQTPPNNGHQTPPNNGHQTPPNNGHQTPPNNGHQTPPNGNNTQQNNTGNHDKDGVVKPGDI